MNNRFNDPFYAESSFVRSAEESGDYDQPAGPANNPSTFPFGWSVTGNTGTANTSSMGNTGNTGSKIKLDTILQNAPNIITAVGGIVGTVGAIKNQAGGGTQDSVKAVCGRKPLFNNRGQKDKYMACAERVLNPPKIQELPPPGMSTTTKVLIGAGIFIFLIVIVLVIIKVSKNKSN